MKSATNFDDRPACPLCGDASAVSIFSEPYTNSRVAKFTENYYKVSGTFDSAVLEGANFTILKCKCGMYWQREVPNSAMMQVLYEGWLNPAWGFSVDWGGDMAPVQFRTISEVRALITRSGKPSTQLRVLDVGMGWSRWLVTARALGCTVYGIELSPARRAFAERHGVELIDWEDLGSKQFDIINCDQVLEHVVDPVDSLKAIVGALAPGGILRVGVPKADGIEAVLASFDWHMPDTGEDRSARFNFLMHNPIGPLLPLQHINGFTKATFRDLLHRAGLELIRPGKAELSTWSMAGGGLKALVKNGLEMVVGQRFTNIVTARRAQG